MNLLAMAMALLAERAFPHGTALGESRLLAFVLRRLRSLGALADHTALPWLLAVLAGATTAGLAQLFSAPIPQVLFSGLMLFLCLGPRDLADDVHRLIAARARGDVPEIERLSRLLQSGPAPDESHRSLIGALFIQSHERLFGALLWFIAFGPAAAVGYRVASRLPALLDQQGFSARTRQSADQLHAAGAWVPARLCAAVFALAGSMDDALAAWKKIGELHFNTPWRRHTWAVLAEVGAGALAMEDDQSGTPLTPDLDTALEEVLRMQTRALLVVLAGFVVFTTGTLL